MHPPTDTELLEAYAATRSETAFAELVRRHVDFVHSAAIRLVCDPHLAQDVTQGTFVALAQNASQVAGHPVLAGWLHRTTRNIAAQTVRTIERRRAREQEAATMNQLLTAGNEPAWESIAPHLDDALGELEDADRDAVLLRYFQKKSAAEMAGLLGISDDAAQKRVSRAVDRLREFFSKRKVTIGAGALITVLSANAVSAAPAGLAATVTGVVLAGTAASTTAATLTATKAIAMTTLQKVAVTAALAALAGAGIYEAHQAQKLRADNQSLQKQMDATTAENHRLANNLAEADTLKPLTIWASAPITSNSSSAIVIATPTNFWADLTNRSMQVKLTHEQAEAFLSANGRNAVNLLAAFRTTHDASLLQEAMSQFPNDPQVAFEATQGTISGSLQLSPAEQRQWLDTFEKDAPKNSLANYLSAADYFNNGDIEHGIQELTAGSGKNLDDYNASRAESDVEAYQSAGYSLAEATQFGTSQLLLPQLRQLKSLAQESSQLASAYQQSGNTPDAQNVLLLADTLGRQYATPEPGEPLISQLVGIAIEKIALNSMDPNAPYGDSGQTVQERLNQLTQQRTQIQQLDQQTEPLLPSMTPDDLITYKNRWLMFGEQNAQQWLVNKYGHP